MDTRIPDFAGYADEHAKRIADEQVRAVVGEALALLHDRHADYFNDETTEMYDALLLRCEFTNQEVFKTFEYVHLSEERLAAIQEADAALVGAAGLAESIDAAHLKDYLQGLTSAFDGRDNSITNT